MDEKLSNYDNHNNENTIRADYELLLRENAKLKKKLSTLEAIIDGIADDHEDVLNRANLIKVIENQTTTIKDLKSFIARKQDYSLYSFVLSLIAKNSMLSATVLNCIARNTELHNKIIRILDSQSNIVL